MSGSRGGGQGVRTPPENHKNIGFLRNTCPDPLTNHKATEPVFNVGPSWIRQRNAIYSAIWILHVPYEAPRGEGLCSLDP